MKKIAILGATGSIGRQVLDVLGDEYQIALLSANVNGELLMKEFYSYKTPITIVSNFIYPIDENDANVHVFGTNILADKETYKDIDVVVNGISGLNGIAPSFAVLESDAKLITANKETFVCAGYAFMERAKELGAKVGEKIIPIDSEHSSVWQCLRGEEFTSIDSITLTASGGAFRDLSKERISSLKAVDALRHPNWKMGRKVTIDSATLMNKGFEIIEAKHLFQTDNIEVLVHRESYIHASVTFKDGSSKLLFSLPDMRLPIQYALTEPNRVACKNIGKAHLKMLENLKFTEPDLQRFPCLKIAIEVAKLNADAPSAIMCIADEVAVELFLKNLISFYGISDIIEKTLKKFSFVKDINPYAIESIKNDVEEYILTIVGE